MAAKPGYLYRRQSGIYVVRICIPARLRAAVGHGEVHVSTGQRELASAKILAFQTLADWKARLMRLDRMDVLQLEAGSPLLGGDGFLPLDVAANAVGLTAPALAGEAASLGEDLHVFADGWTCWVVPDIREVERDHDGTIMLDDALERGHEQRLSQHLIWPDTHAVAAQLAATGSTGECRFYLDSLRRKAAFLPLPGVDVPASQIKIHKSAADRVRGTLRARLTPETIQAAREAASRAQQTHAAPQGHRYAAMKAGALVAAFMSAKTEAGAWKHDHRQKMETELNAFVELMEDPPLADLDRPAIDRYRSRLLRLPANIYQTRRKLGADLSLSALAEQAAARGMPTMTATTADGYIRRLSELFNWAVKSDYMPKNPAQATAPKRKTTRDQDEREAFSGDDLARIFGAVWYRTGQGERAKNGTFRTFRPHYYWLPLLGLYTGARINELSQLYLADVQQTPGGTWFLDINLNGADKLSADDETATGDKSLKTVNSERSLPLHSALLALGFVDYCQALRDAGHVRLFPELRYDRVKGYGKAATNWFNERYLGRALKMERNGKKVFHSFRHTFITALFDLGIPDATVSQLSGHAQDGGMAAVRYRKDQNADKLKPYIERLSFSLPSIAPFNVSAGMEALADGLSAKQLNKC